jgi:renalase
MKQRIAIIGAGFSGLTLAAQLAPIADVVVFEKARGVGGRMSTRYAQPYYFDHGTQFFTARTKPFKSYIEPYLRSGVIAQWTGKAITLEAHKKITDRLWFEPHYVACPNMNSLCKIISEGLAVQLGCEVAPLTKAQPDGWPLYDSSGKELGIYDLVISTAPSAQTVKLFNGLVAHDASFKSPQLLGCYTLMLGFNKPWDRSWIAAKVHNSLIEWIAINSTKPQRDTNVTSMVIHSNNGWAETHIDDDMQQAEIFFKQQLELLMDINCSAADYCSLHRWRYALVKEQKPLPPFFDGQAGLATTGDWCTASRIEDVWTNAMALAKQIKKHIHA